MSFLDFLTFTKGKKEENKQMELTEDEVIEMLKVSPDRFHEFENYYKTKILPNAESSGDFFDVNSRQAAVLSKGDIDISVEDTINRIVKELLSDTEKIVYDGNSVSCSTFSYDIEHPVTLDEIQQIPRDLRPELTGKYMKVDIKGDTHKELLWILKKFQEEKDPKKKTYWYHHFRQGLDILDVDYITSEIIGMNVNSMSHWLPQLIDANIGKKFFKIPKTIIAKLPVPLLQLTRNDYMSLTPTTKEIVNRWARKAFGLKLGGDYFIKTGTYSSKYDFRNCRVRDDAEIKELGEYLLYIHFAALQMASPLNQPVVYGVSTTNEWVVREFITDKEHNPTIYKGLPLHTEYRVFVDCDEKKVLGMIPYWESNTMKKRFAEHRDGHDVHDEIVYQTYEEKLMSRYNENKDDVIQHIEELVQELDLSGQWSIDVMQNGEDFWLIDMALAERSFGCDIAVAVEDRHLTPENWIPKI